MIYSPYITLASEWDNALARDVCRHANHILRETYPGYSWKVLVKQGVCFVRLLDSRLRHPWGINLKLRAVDHDAEFFKRKVKFAAGEFLERAGISRQGNTDELIIRIDGLPQRSQPIPPRHWLQQMQMEHFKRAQQALQVYENAQHVLRAA